MADETMFERLQQRLVDEAKRQCAVPSTHGPYWASEPNEFNSTMYLHGTFDMAAIVRALLTELRTMAVELPDGFVTVASFTDAPKVTIAATDQTVVKAGAVGFIDAILAEANEGNIK